jgi:hypothetical protein
VDLLGELVGMLSLVCAWNSSASASLPSRLQLIRVIKYAKFWGSRCPVNGLGTPYCVITWNKVHQEDHLLSA